MEGKEDSNGISTKLPSPSEKSESQSVENTCVTDSTRGEDGDAGSANEEKSQETKEKKCVFSAEQAKLWKVVEESPSDFTSWTQLLQAVEQKGELPQAKKVFDAFLQRFPYCFGYWKKYGDLVNRLSGPQEAIKVFERGVLAIPLSVDLWMHYIKFTTNTSQDKEDFIATLRRCRIPIYSHTMRVISLSCIARGGDGLNHKALGQCVEGTPPSPQIAQHVLLYDRAVTNCGLDFRSDKLWLSYLEWEKGNAAASSSTPPAKGRLQHVLSIYDQLLSTPTQQHQQHFESFMGLAGSVTPQELLSTADYDKLSSELKPATTGDETSFQVQLQYRVMEQRRSVFQHTAVEIQKRRHFEDAIKRPYFHIKPLERSQLRNWQEYLNFEIETGDIRRILTLFERCMIACAMYEDFWMKFAKFTEDHHTPEYTRSVYSRACQVHLRHKPALHLAWASYEEQQGNVDGARAILSSINSSSPGHALIQLRRVGLEVRHRHYTTAESLFSSFTSEAQSNEARAFYAWRYARFLAHVRGNMDQAVQVLKDAVEKEPSNLTLHLQLVDMVMSRSPLREEEVESVFERAVSCEELTEADRHTLAAHRLQYMEEFSTDIVKINKVFNEHKAGKRAHGRKRNASDANSSDVSKKTKEDSAADQPSSHPIVPPSSLPTVVDNSSSAATTPVPGWGAYQQQSWGMNYPSYGQAYGYQQQQQQQQQQWGGYQYPTFAQPSHHH